MGSNRKRGWKENSGWTGTRDVKSRISLKIGARIDGILSHNRGWKKQRRTMATDFSSGWYAVYFVQKFSLFPVGKGIHRTTIVRGTNWYLAKLWLSKIHERFFPLGPLSRSHRERLASGASLPPIQSLWNLHCFFPSILIFLHSL